MQTALPFPPALAVRNVRSHASLGRANERILILRNTGCTERVTLEYGQCYPRFLGQGIICCVWKCFDLKSRIVLILGHMQCIAQKLSLFLYLFHRLVITKYFLLKISTVFMPKCGPMSTMSATMWWGQLQPQLQLDARKNGACFSIAFMMFYD